MLSLLRILNDDVEYESKRVVEYKNYSLPKPIVIKRAKAKSMLGVPFRDSFSKKADNCQ